MERLKQKKSLGQVFLHENWPCQKMAETICKWESPSVLEIGPGGGMLTKSLLNAGLSVLAVEKDDRFINPLQQLTSNLKLADDVKFEVFSGDALTFDYPQWLLSDENPKTICGNIPYNISSPLLITLLPYLNRLQGIILLVQKEFGERVAAQPDSKTYGSISVFAQLRSRVQVDFEVSRRCFTPVPKVDSVVISLRQLENPYGADVLQRTEILTRMAFNQRRKKLRNSLSSLIQDMDHHQLPVDLDRRAETLSPEEFVALANSVFSQGQTGCDQSSPSP